MKKSPQKDFYKELDLSKQRKGSCNCLSISIIFILIFILVEGMVFYLFEGVRVDPSTSGASVAVSGSSSNISTMDLSDGQIRVVVSQGVLCSKLVSQNSNLFKDISCQITPDGIEITGKLGTLIPSNATAIIVPKVEKEKLNFEMTKLLIGNINAPKFLAKSLGDMITKLVYDQAPELNKASIKTAELQDGVMIITASRI